MFPVRVTIAVTPPYSTKISDYTSQPNKIMATVQNLSPTGQSYQVYLGGSITGSGGIRVYTEPGYKPPQPLKLLPGANVLLTLNTIGDVFSEDHLIYEGITSQEIIYGNGLPEGDYTICLQAFDYATGEPLSEEEPSGCSAPFAITDLEPPVVLQPFCQDTVQPMFPQNLLISWTMPAGAPANTQYKLLMIEVLPADHNIYDALNSATHPVFFETLITGNAFIMGAAQPALVTGKTYAFVVAAIDPAGKTSFRNNGMSEACSFVYGHDQIPSDPTVEGIIEPSTGIFDQEFELIPNTVISGRLLCKFPDNPDGPLQFSLPNTVIAEPGNVIINPGGQQNNGNYQVNYNVVAGVGSFIQGNANSTSIGYGFYFPGSQTNGNGATQQMNEYGDPLIFKMKSKKFIFENTENLQFTKPLPNTTVRLVARVAIFGMMNRFGIDYPAVYAEDNLLINEALDLNGQPENAVQYTNLVLDVTQTDDNGNFTFDFSAPFFTGPVMMKEMSVGVEEDMPVNPLDELQWNVFPGEQNQFINITQNQNLFGGLFSGAQQQQQQQVMSTTIHTTSYQGYLCLKVEVENQKFCSPDIDIFAMPGDVINLPVQVAKLKTYNLTLKVKSNNQANQLNNANAPLAGVAVNIFRKDSDVAKELPMIINYEGQRLNTKTYNSNGVFRNVSTNKTDLQGEIKFRNLVRHAYINPQYLIDFSTRDFDKVETSYDNTLYNYKNIFTDIPTTGARNAIMGSYSKSIYNHEYPAPTEDYWEVTMEPLPPEIKGRVMALSNIQNTGLPGVKVELLNQSNYNKYGSMAAFINSCYGNVEKQTNTNASGFFRFPDLPVNDNNPDHNVLGPYRRLYIKYPAYKPVIIPPIDQFPYNLSYGQLKDVKDINLEPENMVAGYVQDEEGLPVAAYVKSAYSPFYKTTKKLVTGGPLGYKIHESFSVPTQYDNVQLTINPLSSQYFNRDTSFLISNSEACITVYKKLHRPVIKVRNSSGDLISGAIVSIGTHKVTTNALGEARFKFAAPAEQFVIRIEPPTGYAPMQASIVIPVSASWKNYNYVVKTAKTIRGKITELRSKEPVEGARVFAELMQTDGMPLYLEAFSDAQGFYSLSGIPTEQKLLTVHVVKAGSNPSWIGTKQTISLTSGNSKGVLPAYNFSIQRIGDWDLTTMWGFPIVVESFAAQITTGNQPPEAQISGFLLQPPSIGGFSLLQSDLKVPFSKIMVKRGQDNKPEPKNPVVTLETIEIPIGIAGTYTGSLFHLKPATSGHLYLPGMQPQKQKLTLNHSAIYNSGAGIAGQVKLALNSFQIANNFNGDLYLGDDTLSSTAVVFTAENLNLPANQHYVFSITPNLKPVPIQHYQVFNFNADADLGLSVQQGNEIRLRSILHTSIPACLNCQPLDLKIRAGDLLIKGNEISFVESPGEKLNFSLEKWKVYSQKSWTFDKNEESIILPEVLIVTGQGVDARVKNMKIRPTSLTEGTIDLTGGLTLGGVANLKLSGTLQPVFNFDAGVGHYRISVVGQSNQPAGYVDNLPNTSPSKLDFQSIGMLSNDENVLTIGKQFRFYNIMDMYVDQIMTGNGFFKLNGQPDVGIPSFIPQSAVVAYHLENSKLKATVEPLKGVVECSGNVNFILDPAAVSQSVTNGKFTTYGDVKIMPAPGESGSPVYLRGFLTKTNSKCGFEIIKVDQGKLYAGNLPQELFIGPSKFFGY